jgi:hypothetical protein
MVTMEHKNPKHTAEQGSHNKSGLQYLQKYWSYGIKNYFIEDPLNGITSISNFMKIYKLVQNLHHLRNLNVPNFGVMDVTFNVITSMQYFIQINQSV